MMLKKRTGSASDSCTDPCVISGWYDNTGRTGEDCLRSSSNAGIQTWETVCERCRSGGCKQEQISAARDQHLFHRKMADQTE